MHLMTFPPVVEELYLAKKHRKSGLLKVSTQGKESSVRIRQGDVLDVTMAVSQQSLAQALVQNDKLPLRDLDALWHDGSVGHASSAFWETKGISERESDFFYVLSNLRQLVRQAEKVEFEEAPVEGEKHRVDGGFLVVAALKDEPLHLEPGDFQCTQMDIARLWGRTVEDSAFLDSLETFRPLHNLTPSMRALVKVLLRENLLIQKADWEDAPIPLELTQIIEVEKTDVSANALTHDETPTPLFELPDEDDMGDASDSDKRRQRMLRRAMENLGTLPPSPSAANVNVNVVEEAVTAEATPLPVEPENLSSAELQLARQIEARFQFLAAKADHFSVLGIAKSASRDQIKDEYFKLAKTFHPDRLPPSLSSLSNKMNAVFESIREAYEVLSDEGRKAAYEAQLSLGPSEEATVTRKALSEFHEGELALKRRDFRRAESLFMGAHQRQPRADFLAAAAWAIFSDPSRKADAPKALQLMNEALKLDSACERAHYQLGVIARMEGNLPQAERHFKEALAQNPRHVEAGQELRLIEMRRRNEKKGLF